MIHAGLGRLPLQLTVAIHDTDGADMVALGKEQFQNHLAIFDQSRRMGIDHHALLHRGDTGGKEFIAPGHLDHAEPARAPITQPLQVTERGDLDLLLAQYFQHRLTFPCADQFTIDG